MLFETLGERQGVLLFFQEILRERAEPAVGAHVPPISVVWGLYPWLICCLRAATLIHFIFLGTERVNLETQCDLRASREFPLGENCPFFPAS